MFCILSGKRSAHAFAHDVGTLAQRDWREHETKNQQIFMALYQHHMREIRVFVLS